MNNQKMAAIRTGQLVSFPTFSGIRCLMMPYVQGYSDSVPEEYHTYKSIIDSVFLKKGDIGFLTIDESLAVRGTPHRGQRAKFPRALHTEAGKHPIKNDFHWVWGGKKRVILDREVRILLANNLDNSCAVWNMEHEDTSEDGDIGHVADMYPYNDSVMMKAGEVHNISILTPHESLPVRLDFQRQFLRIVSSGVHGREEYFTRNPLVAFN